MRDEDAHERVKIAIRVSERELAHRLSAALADVEGLELVEDDDVADVTIVTRSHTPRADDLDVQLTLREIEVLQLLAEGASNKLIARRLGISTHTAKYHVGSLLDKLDAVSRTDAVALAAKFGMINL